MGWLVPMAERRSSLLPGGLTHGVAALLLVASVAACSGAAATPTPSATPFPTPSPTVTPTPSPSPSPSPTIAVGFSQTAAGIIYASADGTTSGVVVSGNYAYVLSGTRGLRIYSVLPQLSINLATNRVRLSWPAPASFVVQQNPDLNTTNWVSLTNGPVSVGSQSEVVIPPPAGKMFYRLMSQ